MKRDFIFPSMGVKSRPITFDAHLIFMAERCKITGRFKPIEIEIGATYFWWTILEFSHKAVQTGNRFYKCECACGNIRVVDGGRISRGESKSCGCYRYRKGQNKTHGLRYHPLYSVWRGIRDRCLNPNSSHWLNYGGRGIEMCERWKSSMKNFYDDMIDGYQKGLHIGRIDNNGHYCKENCRWETPLENSHNKRNTPYVTIDGRMHIPVHLAKEYFVKADTIRNRLRKGHQGWDAIFGKKFKMDEDD